jgi:hypothetical protein
MSKSTKKRAVIYSNVKENKRLAEEKNKKKNEQINLNDEVIIGFNSKKKNQESFENDKLKKKTEHIQKKDKIVASKKYIDKSPRIKSGNGKIKKEVKDGK